MLLTPKFLTFSAIGIGFSANFGLNGFIEQITL
jgi:hypothetical protein